MKVNATFFIQITNLFVTYKILKSFFFKPVITFLENKKYKLKKIKNEISEKEKELLSLEREKDKNLLSFQIKTKKKYPFIPQYIRHKELKIKPPKEKPEDTDLSIISPRKAKKSVNFLLFRLTTG